jgi:hypothetical protein
MTTNVLPYQPAATAIYELVEVIQKNAPPMRRHSGMRR